MANKSGNNNAAPAKSAANGSAVQKGVKGFQIGKSGNLKGRPKGSRNWATHIAEQMVEGDAEAIIGGLIEKGKNGHFGALKFLAERLLATRRSRPLTIALPAIETPADIVKAIDQIWSALCVGMISPDESEHLLRLLEAKRKAIETLDLAAEIEQIKEQMEVAKCRETV